MSNTFQLKNESFFVLAEALGGVYNSEQLRAIAEICDEESAIIKMTEEHCVGFMVSAANLDKVQSAIRKAGMIPKHYRSHQLLSARGCLGELCPHHEQDALGDAIEVSGQLNERFPNGVPHLRIALNGCWRNCLASGTDDIHLVADGDGYKIQIGGKNAELPQIGQFLTDNVSTSELPDTLAKVVDTFLSGREEEESFHDFVDRVGVSGFAVSDAAQEAKNGTDALLPEESEALLDNAETALEEDMAMEDDFSEEEADALLGVSNDEDEDLSETDSLDDDSLDDDSLDDDSLEADSLDDDSLEADSLDDDSLDDDSLDDDSLEESLMTDELAAAEADFDSDSLDDETPIADIHETSVSEPDDGLEDEGSASPGAAEDLTLDELQDENDGAGEPQLISMDSNLKTAEVPVESELSADGEISMQGEDLSALGDEGESSEIQDESQLSDTADLMGEELGIEETDATDDDLQRVTAAMRSEAKEDDLDSSEQAEGNDESELDREVNGALRSPTSTEELSEDFPEEAAGAGKTGEQPDDDIPQSFLALQDQAKDSGTLQVKFVEDTLCIATPDGAKVNLPFGSLVSGLQVVVNIGQFEFSVQLSDGILKVKFNDSIIQVPATSFHEAGKRAA